MLVHNMCRGGASRAELPSTSSSNNSKPSTSLGGSSRRAVLDPRPTLSRARARAVYDRVGSKANDTESWVGEAEHCVVEFGHGTGSFAQRLFARNLLRPACKYIGVDQSSTMAQLAHQKLEPYKAKVELKLSDGSPAGGTGDLAASTVDRFVSTYVLDLLSEDDVLGVLREAHRLLKPEGLLCATGITYGTDLSSWLMATVWELLYAINKEIVGGCRPQNLRPYLEQSGFEVKSYMVVQGDRKSFLGFMNNEVIIAAPCAAAAVVSTKQNPKSKVE